MKKIILIIVLIIVTGGGLFYGGMKYGQNKNSLSSFSRQSSQNISIEQRQQLLQGRVGGGVVANFLNGEVIDKDDQSLTLKMPDNSSKIIFFSGSTKISKTADGTKDDIEIGKQITINGEQNSDGSYVAKTIQLSQGLFDLRNNQ